MILEPQCTPAISEHALIAEVRATQDRIINNLRLLEKKTGITLPRRHAGVYFCKGPGRRIQAVLPGFGVAGEGASVVEALGEAFDSLDALVAAAVEYSDWGMIPKRRYIADYSI